MNVVGAHVTDAGTNVCLRCAIGTEMITARRRSVHTSGITAVGVTNNVVQMSTSVAQSLMLLSHGALVTPVSTGTPLTVNAERWRRQIWQRRRHIQRRRPISFNIRKLLLTNADTKFRGDYRHSVSISDGVLRHILSPGYLETWLYMTWSWLSLNSCMTCLGSVSSRHVSTCPMS